MIIFLGFGPLYFDSEDHGFACSSPAQDSLRQEHERTIFEFGVLDLAGLTAELTRTG